jgi:hypothetical protein
MAGMDQNPYRSPQAGEQNPPSEGRQPPRSFLRKMLAAALFLPAAYFFLALLVNTIRAAQKGSVEGIANNIQTSFVLGVVSLWVALKVRRMRNAR